MARKQPTKKKQEKKGSSAGSSKKGLLSFFKRLFPAWSSDRLSKDLRKVKELSASELSKQELSDKMFSKSPRKAKKKSSYSHVRTRDLLSKAGLALEPVDLYKRVFYAALVVTSVVTVAAFVYAWSLATPWVDVLWFMLAWWSAGFAGVLLVVGLVAAGYLDVLINRRRKEVEEVLPDFLQLTAANIGAGMPIDRALWFAVRPRFGVLAKEIETVAKRVLTGEELDVALRRFSNQYDSPVLSRSINLLLEGVAAGGQIADLLHKISVDIQEQRILQKEMAASVMTYVIFISFASVLAAPVLFGLSTELLTVIQSIAANMGDSVSGGMLSISGDVISLSDFRLFSLVVLVGSAVMSALIVGVIRSGSAKEGLRFVAPFVACVVVLYVLSVAFFHSLFGGLV